MVQTIFYHLDATHKAKGDSNISKSILSEKLSLQNHTSSNMYIEPDKLKIRKNDCVKLQPLNINAENNVLSSAERKFLHKLDPPSGAVEKTGQKRASKIPVLQRKVLNGPKLKNDNGCCNKILSAADRRQKFHQSRVRIAAAEDPETFSILNKQKIDVYHDLLSWYNGYVLQQVNIPSVPAVNQKNILPPIKVVDVTPTTGQKANQPKNKCLLGEITHFPALCSPSCIKRQKNCNTSSVPHLPPILPPPAAPPPSISTSVEQEGNRVNEQIRNAKMNGVGSPKCGAQSKLIV